MKLKKFFYETAAVLRAAIFFAVLFCLQAYAEEPPTATERVVMDSCFIEGDTVYIHATLDLTTITSPELITGADPNLYLLEQQPFEDGILNKYNVGYLPKTSDLQFALPLHETNYGSRLYNKFVLAVWDSEKYQIVSEPIYINNPEAVSQNHTPYELPASKKGLLIDFTQAATAVKLGVSHVIVNIPWSHILGEGISYWYEGETYHFNREIVEKYDQIINTFSSNSMQVTAVILNSWNQETPELFYPGMQETPGIKYYLFNARTEAGYKDIRAIMTFLAERYSGLHHQYGRISNWIIGNEINNQAWNYVGAMDLDSYVREYERAFRVFYTAIKSQNASDKVFFSLDNNWMNEADHQLKYNGKELLDRLNERMRRTGNINWNLAFHPYSVPTAEPEFWDDYETGLVRDDEFTPVISIANISTLTYYLNKPEFKDKNQTTRRIILSEQGFTSQSQTRGTVEAEQAAAFAYAYYIIDSNPYIDSFILSRQVDAPSEVAQGLAFGLYECIGTDDNQYSIGREKLIWSVFQNIDIKSKTLETTAFAKEILGITRWSDVVPNFRWKNLE